MDCCTTCHFDPKHNSKKAGEVSPALNRKYHEINNELVAAMIFEDEAGRCKIHTCNQTNPQLCITRDARPCRGFLNLLRSHVAHYQEHGYASYLKFAGETGMVALPKSRLVFWRDVSELLLVERDAAEAQPKSE